MARAGYDINADEFKVVLTEEDLAKLVKERVLIVDLSRHGNARVVITLPKLSD